MPPSRAQARLAEFLETAERLKNERAAAGGVLETVESTPPESWPTLATHPEFQTNAALELLSEEVRRRIDRDPRQALILADLAVAIAEAMPATAYPAVTLAQIKATAWKDRATVLRFLGRIQETFESIRRAEEILDRHVALGLDRAVVDLVKALTLLNTNECDEARAIAITCGSVFLAHGDLDRALQAGEIEGHVLFEKQRYGDAQTLFNSLLEIARVIDDANAQARCHHNAGYCAVNLGDFKNANIHFSEAISKLTDLGKPVAASRTQWGVGQVLIGKGQIDSGLKHLQAAREAFMKHELFEESGLCGLSIAEALLSRGAEKEARDIVHEVAAEFLESPIERRIVDAVVALEQTMVDSEAPLEAVRNVYALIESQSKQAAL